MVSIDRYAARLGRRREFIEMKPKIKTALTAIELVAVLLITAVTFSWGRETARLERGDEAYGGEYLLLLIPVIYYTGRRIVLDWIAYLRKRWGMDELQTEGVENE